MPDQAPSPFDASRQDEVAADLVCFFGPRNDAYLRFFERKGRVRRKGYAGPLPGWSWSAFGAWTGWFWYRKLWLAGALCTLLPTLADLLPGVWPGLLAYLLAVLFAKEAALSSALRYRARADALGLGGAERSRFLAARGGVSVLGASVGTLVVVAVGVYECLSELATLADQLNQAGLAFPG